MTAAKHVLCSGCGYAVSWLEHTELKAAVDCPRCAAKDQFGPGIYAEDFQGYPLVLERDVEAYLTKRVKSMGGETRKVKWIGRRGAPDRLVMTPPRVIDNGFLRPTDRAPGRTIWVELKAPGVKPEAYQLREHERMRALGQHVVVVNSFEGVDALLS